MCVGSMVHAPWLSDITLLARKHRLHLGLTLPPVRAGRHGFIICEVPADSPARAGSLPSQTPPCPVTTMDRVSRPRQRLQPHYCSCKFSHSGKPEAVLCRHTRSGAQPPSVGLFLSVDRKQKNKFSTSRSRRGGPELQARLWRGLGRASLLSDQDASQDSPAPQDRTAQRQAEALGPPQLLTPKNAKIKNCTSGHLGGLSRQTLPGIHG